jgi:hypothetical protein
VRPAVITFREAMAAKQAVCASRVLTLSCGRRTSSWRRAEPKPQVIFLVHPELPNRFKEFARLTLLDGGSRASTLSVGAAKRRKLLPRAIPALTNLLNR